MSFSAPGEHAALKRWYENVSSRPSVGELATANGVAGGKQTVHTAGLNWYVNRNVRFMFNYLHGDIAKQVSATNVGDVGAKFDAFAVRTHIAF